MNNFPAMHFPLGARGNNFDSQIKRILFASNGVFCACIHVAEGKYLPYDFPFMSYTEKKIFGSRKSIY